MFQFSKYPMDILEMLSGHQAHQFKGLGLERQLSHQQVQLQHQQQLQQQHQPSADTSGSLLSGLGLGSLQSSRSNAFADSSSLFAKMSAPPPSISHQSQSSSSHSSRKSSKISSSSSSGSGSSSSGYPQFLRPFHPAEAALAQEQLHSG
uniref:Uncharacterized protein n=2 Tax=Xiphophorus maculatus TaxID=8083 RepID=A0A3B5R134_XIPMA